MRGPHRFQATSRDLLIDPERRRRQSPEQILRGIDPIEGEMWADLGCGVGYLSIPLVSMGARVIAIDVQREMLDALVRRASEGDIERICPLVADIPPLPLTDGSMDGALLVNVLHEVGDRELMAREMQRVLRPGGTLLLIDFRKRESPHGPPVDERVAEEETIRLFESFEMTGKYVHEEHYQLEFRRSRSDILR